MRKAKRGGDHLTRGFRKSISASKNESLVSVMRKAKRGGDHLTGDFRKSRSASKNESLELSQTNESLELPQTNESLVSGCLRGDSDQGVWSGLSDRSISHLSKSVASIALYNGDTILFSCSGIAMERQGWNLTRFLTSASLVRAVHGTNKDHDDLKIEVRPEGNEVYMGLLDEFDLDCNFAVVNVHAFLDVQVGSFQHALQILPHGHPLVLVGRGVSGEIIAKNIEFDRLLTVSEDDEDVVCETPEAWDGGPLFSIHGEFVGMILFLTARRAVFLPWGTILKHLEHYWASQQKKTGLARSKTSKFYSRVGAKLIGEKSNSHPEVHRNFLTQEQLDLYYMGYPKLPSFMLGAGMILVNSFEETFGDIHGEGVWRNFGKRASNIDRNVVALVSFNGEKRFFACTGFFIEWNGSTIILTSASLVRDSGDENEVLQNLTIEVLFRNQRSKGTLEHCNLHYNVAVISVKNRPSVRPPNTLLRLCNIDKVAAIGRCFESGALMATSGGLVSWTGTLDCDFLTTSTCKITKAGIGGPLVTLDGDVIGMNFYDKKIGTPFLGMAVIYDILTSFETKSKLGEVGNDSDPSAYFWKMDDDDETKLNRWPVPEPCWCNPDQADEDKSDDESVSDCKSRFALRYGYIKGEKVILC